MSSVAWSTGPPRVICVEHNEGEREVLLSYVGSVSGPRHMYPVTDRVAGASVLFWETYYTWVEIAWTPETLR